MAVARSAGTGAGAPRVVSVADPDDVAISLYASLGYRRGVSAWQIERPPPARLTPPDAAES